jgi:MerR family transcriptional regulator, light-induced transcriptional regulator
MAEPMPDPGTFLTTAQLALRTGVPAGTLRMWEARHGFPMPTRLPGGHRRYTEHDIELVRAVTVHRQEGLSLPAAIERARSGRTPQASSIFAGLRERRPELAPITLGKPALLALSRAIEDEYLARARSGVLVGSFQTPRFYRQSERRWRELARTAQIAVVLAEFEDLRESPRDPCEVPVGRDHPLAREWAIVSSAPGAWACLAAWEVPDVAARSDASRRFEVLFSPQPEVVHLALSGAAELIAPLARGVVERRGPAMAPSVPASTPELRSATALVQRMLGYLADRLESRE